MASQNTDLFVSHNSKDKGFIDYIAKRLHDEYDVKLWLDKWNLEAAVDWAPAIEKALQTCDSCAVVLGANGWGPHHLGEAQLALKRKREYPNFRVIPILLPGASSENMQVLGDFFQQVHRVEFTGEGPEEEAFQRFWATIRGEAPGPPLMTAYKIERDAKYWQRLSSKDKRSALYAGEKLRDAQEIAERKDEPVSDVAKAFLEASVSDERDRLREAQRRTSKVIGGLVFGLIVVSILAAVALIQRNWAQTAADSEREAKLQAVQAAEREKNARAGEEEQRIKAEASAHLEREAKEDAQESAAEARRQQHLAEKNAAEAKRQQHIAEQNEERAAREGRRNIAQKLATQSDVQSVSDPQRAGLWAAEAIRVTQLHDGNMTSEARAAANRALATLTGSGHHGYFKENVTGVIFNRDESLLAAADWGGVIQVFELSKHYPQSLRHVIYTDEFTSVVVFDAPARHLITHLKSQGCGPHVDLHKKTQGCGPGLVWTLDDTRKYPQKPMPLSEGPFESMAASRDNSLLAAATAREVIIYDLADVSNLRVVRRLQKSSPDAISVLEFSRDGALLLSGSHNGWVQVWELGATDPRPKTQFESKHVATQLGRETSVPIEIIHISDDRSALVTASRDWIGDSTQADRAAKLWRLDNLRPIGTPRALTHRQAISSVDFVHSDHSIVTTSLDGQVLHWSDNATDTTPPVTMATAQCDCNPSDPFKNISSAAVSPKDNVIAVATSDGAVRLISLSHLSKDTVDLRGHPTDFVTFSRSGKWLVSGGVDRSLRIWNIDHQTFQGNIALVGDWQQHYVTSELSPSGKTALLFTADHIEAWDISNPDAPRLVSVLKSSLGKNECPTCQVQVSPDGKWLVAQSEINKNSSIVRTIDGSTEFNIPVRTWRSTGESNFSPDSSWLLVDEKEGGRLYDLSQHPVASKWLENIGEDIYFGSAKFSKDGKWLFAQTSSLKKTKGATGYLWRIHPQRRDLRRFDINDFSIGLGEFSPDGQWFAYAADGFNDYLDDGRMSAARQPPPNTTTKREQELTSVKLVSLSQLASELETTTLYGHELKPTRLVFSANGRWLLTATSDILARQRETRVRLWDLHKEHIANRSLTLPLVDRLLREAVFSPDGRFLVTVQGTDDFARLWHLDNLSDQFVLAGALRGGLPNLNHHWTVTFSPDSNRVVISTLDDPTPYLWFLAPNGSPSDAKQIRAGDGALLGVEFSQDSTKLFALSSTTRGTQLNMFDVQRPDQELNVQQIFSSDTGKVRQFQLSRDLQHILIFGKEFRTVRVEGAETLLALLAETVGRNMTWEEWVLTGQRGPYQKTFQEFPVNKSVLTELAQQVGAGEKKAPGSVPINQLVDWTIEFDEPSVCNHLAWSLATVGDGRQSSRAVACALKHFPNNGNYRDTRGVARALLGDIKGAIEDFNAFLESATENGEKIEMIEERRTWIKELSGGRNPFLQKR